MSNTEIAIAITASFAGSFTYMFLKYWIFFEKEVREAAEWYARKRGWSVRDSDIEATRPIIRDFVVTYGLLAFGFWALVIAILSLTSN